MAKDNRKPLVSVIIPSYNHEKYISQAIESIVNQTYRDFELIVIDDGSKDNSVAILKDLQLKYGFKLFLQENHGTAYTINRGLKESTSVEYITFCASDDYWLPTKIEKQIDFMESNYFYPMCYGKTYYVDEDSKIFKISNRANQKLKGGWLFDDILLFRIHPPVNYMYRKKIFNEIGNFDEKIFAEDYYMNLKIASKYCIGFLDEYLGFYRYINTATKIARFDFVADSHLMVIDEFKDQKFYKKAKLMVYLRKFDYFSGFTMHKNKALINLYKSVRLFYNRRFFLSVIKLLFYWKA